MRIISERVLAGMGPVDSKFVGELLPSVGSSRADGHQCCRLSFTESRCERMSHTAGAEDTDAQSLLRPHGYAFPEIV